MGLTPNVVAGAPILSAWGNEIRDRTVQRFATAAERSAQWPAPPAGALSRLDTAPRVIYVYDSGAWAPLVPASGADQIVYAPTPGAFISWSLTAAFTATWAPVNVTIPPWATRVQVGIAINGIAVVTAAANYDLKARLGGVDDPHGTYFMSWAAPASDRRSLAWWAEWIMPTPPVGVQALDIVAARSGGTGGARIDVDSDAVFQVRYLGA